MQDLPGWIAAVILTAIFFVFAAYNAWSAWGRLAVNEPAPSPAPIFGGLCGLGAVLSLPLGTVPERLAFAWIPLLLDVSVPITVMALWRAWRKGRTG